jgi:hypothetical protein
MCTSLLPDGGELNASDACSGVYQCSLPTGAEVEDCVLDINSCYTLCGGPTLFCELMPSSCNSEGGALPNSSVILQCSNCLAGRPPRGLQVRAPSGPSLGDHFASMAYFESASVRAFRDLERWLEAHGAPGCLVGQARRAADDERRHARAASRLARRFGGMCERPRVARARMPSLASGLRDDAVAGCVGETFGALIATWQAAHAADARVRRTLRRIARDETRHAALSWEILRWGVPRTNAYEQGRVGAVIEAAVSNLHRSCRPFDDEARRVAGHPTPSEYAHLVHGVKHLVRRELSRSKTHPPEGRPGRLA